MSPSLRVFVFAVVSVAVVPAAVGQTRDPREAEAKKRCLAGQTEAGVALLAEIYVERPSPAYIFNQARCYQQNNRPRDAISRFREYLRKSTEAEGTQRAQAERFIRELEQEEPAARPAPPTLAARPPAPLGPEVASVGKAPPSAPPPLPSTLLSTGAPGPTVSTRWRWPLYASVGVAGASLLTGVALTFKVRSLNESVASNSRRSMRFDRDGYEQGQSVETLQYGAYALGAACLAGAGVFYYLDHRAHRPRASGVALAPLIGRGTTGGLVRVGF